MALALGSVISALDTGQALAVVGTLTASGNYAAGGDAPSWASSLIKSTKAPYCVFLSGIAGFVYVWDRAAGKVWTYTSGANAQDPLAELSAGAYPAGVTGDTITFLALFPKV